MRVGVEGFWTPGMTAMSGPVTLVCEQGTISAIEEGAQGEDVRLRGYAIPGLIDSHEHIGLDVGDERSQSLDDAITMAIRGSEALRVMLHGGVTTIRDCGERADVEPYWIHALQTGTLSGPRVVRSVTPICRTGGHAWYLGSQTDGVDAIRAAVRRNVRDGATFIKVMATGGIGTVGSVADAPEFTDAEFEALIDEAHRLGCKVAAHAHGGPGVDQALAAGVTSIEHGVLLTEQQLRRMASSGVYLVVTMGIAMAFSHDETLPPTVRQRAADTLEGYFGVVRSAKSVGVKVAVGSDCVHGGVAAEVGHLVAAGFTTVEALEAATSGGAELIGCTDIGVLTVGASADIVILGADPLVDIGALKDVAAVMRAGRWVRMDPIAVTGRDGASVHLRDEEGVVHD